jgi:hypothetical protein
MMEVEIVSEMLAFIHSCHSLLPENNLLSSVAMKSLKSYIPVTCLVDGCVGPIVGLDEMAKRELLPLQRIETSCQGHNLSLC